MARHYSIKAFFRDMPGPLLARYFHKRGHFQAFDFTAIKGADREKLFQAWLEIPEDQCRQMEAEFQQILSLSCDQAMPAIIAEAAWQMRKTPEAHAAFLEMFGSLPNHHERAMVAFLDYHDCWRGANLLYYADTLPHWRKRKGFPHLPAAVGSDDIQQLADLISAFFYRTEGRGKHCHIDCLRRDELDYFFAYPADHSRQSNEYVEGNFAPRPHNPAFEVLYIYSQKDGTLDLNFRGAGDRATTLYKFFANAILKLPDLPPIAADSRVYDLDELRRGDFMFSFQPGSGIEGVIVKVLRLASKARPGDRVTVQAEANDERPNAVYELLARIAPSLPSTLYRVDQVELSVSVVEKAGSKPKRVPVRITHPYWCSLKYDDLGTKLRNMLVASGIEPRESSGGAEE